MGPRVFPEEMRPPSVPRRRWLATGVGTGQQDGVPVVDPAAIVALRVRRYEWQSGPPWGIEARIDGEWILLEMGHDRDEMFARWQQEIDR